MISTYIFIARLLSALGFGVVEAVAAASASRSGGSAAGPGPYT